MGGEPDEGSSASPSAHALAPASVNTNSTQEVTERTGDFNPTSSPPQRPISPPFLTVPGVQTKGSSETLQTPSSVGSETLVITSTSDSPLQHPPTPSAFLSVPASPHTRGGSESVQTAVSQTSVNSGSISGGNDAAADDTDPLRPDPKNMSEFEVADNVFAFTPGQLAKLYTKSLPAFRAMGGLAGLEKGLRTKRETGLSLDEENLEGVVTLDEAIASGRSHIDNPATASNIPVQLGDAHEQHDSKDPLLKKYADRIRVFGDNRLPQKKAKSIFLLIWITYNDKILILLTFAAIISLALGLYQTFGQQQAAGQPKVDWVQGVAIIVAIVIVVVVGAGNDWQKERQFVKLNKKKEDRSVKVIRSGTSIQISVYDLLVGDVVHLEPGDIVPVDGIFISGHNVKCDESVVTGESDQLSKTPADEVLRRLEAGESIKKLDPFILSGSRVLEGIGTFLVTSTGVHSFYGKLMMSLEEETDATPLQMKLNGLADGIAKIGGASALLLFVVLLIRFLIGIAGKYKSESSSEKAQGFMRILITSITVIVVAVPEGLPLAVTLALAFATTRMLRDNNLVRVLRACETMGNATTICSDKTGTLTQNSMTVVAGTLGVYSSFGQEWEPSRGEVEQDQEKNAYELSLPLVTPSFDFTAMITDEVKLILLDSIILNSTAFEGVENGQQTFIGSKTETALLEFGRNYLGMQSIAVERANAKIEQLIPFDSGRKCMGIVVKRSNGYRLYVKGASEILLAQCSRIISSGAGGLEDTKLTSENVDTLKEIIHQYACRTLRTIALVYRDFTSWPPSGARVLKYDATKVEFGDVFTDMVFLGVFGIQDPLRDGVIQAVKDCQRAHVVVRMVTGDNVETAKAIAKESGILTEGGVVLEGPQFRRLESWEMKGIIPRLVVLARSSPEDKRILVKMLKELGETVAVTGDGTNDGPALKTADVGFSMGIAGTEVAKEASSIILMDDNFASIVKAIMWGRAVNDAVKKFLQFQLTVNITAVLTTFITGVASDKEQSVLKAVQLLWVNLIMDTLAALALATDPPTSTILDREPDRKNASLITPTMWKLIIGQSVYQLAVALVLQFAGPSILNYPPSDDPNDKRMSALVFNTFVWLQIFNQYNCRRLDNKLNVLEGITHNWIFIAINLIIIGGQVLIMFIGGEPFYVARLSARDWGISLLLGAFSLPFAVFIRLIPFEKLIKGKEQTPRIYVASGRYDMSQPLQEIREELAFLKTIRGGRLNQLKFKTTQIREHIPGLRSNASASEMFSYGTQPPPSPGSSHRRRSRSNSTYTVAAMVPSIVAGSIAAGWSPIERGDGDSTKLSTSSKKSDQEAGVERKDESEDEKTQKT